VLYYVNIGVYALLIALIPLLTLKFNGRPIRFAGGLWIIAAGIAGAAAAVFGSRITVPVLRRFVCSLIYGFTSLSFFASYGMIFGKGELRSEPFLRRFFLFSAVAFAVITLDAAFIRFSLSSRRYIPDGSISLPIYGICAGILVIRNSSRQIRSHSSEISMSDSFINDFVITAREKEIITCLLKGCTNNQISETLFISPRTVDTHFSNIYRKCSVRSRLELVKLISDYS
jgi:DNA-binding CsgD family transcriptional regulator